MDAHGEQTTLEAIADYNKEDCEATRLLRDWLIDRRREAVERYGPIPVLAPRDPSPPREQDGARDELRRALLALGGETPTLAAHLLDYHDRERKPVWWAFFDRLEQTPQDLFEDSDSIGRLAVSGSPEQDKRSLLHTFSYPAQEHKLGQGNDPYDPATGLRAGRIVSLDREQRTLILKRGPSLTGVPLPEALIPGRPFDTQVQEDALARIGQTLLSGEERYPAAESILRRTPFPHPVQTSNLDELKRLVGGLDGGHLFVQGPPGSGKTWTGARLIIDLLNAGKTVGVASANHKAIHNLVEAVEEVGLPVPGHKSERREPRVVLHVGHGHQRHGCGRLRRNRVRDGNSLALRAREFDCTLEYLFIDEAGQVSLADALAMATCARNVVLLGDPLQLGQVLQGSHPGRSESSVLDHLLGDSGTIPPDRGVFLERTFRLHPTVCRYISEAFYESRLHPAQRARERTTPLGVGLRYLAVTHDRRRQESPEEVERVGLEVERLAAAGIHDVLVVAAYNAQVNLFEAAAPRDPSRHRRQVPGSRGRRGSLLPCELERGRRSAQPGLSLLRATV